MSELHKTLSSFSISPGKSGNLKNESLFFNGLLFCLSEVARSY
jgi:hypothetical protein